MFCNMFWRISLPTLPVGTCEAVFPRPGALWPAWRAGYTKPPVRLPAKEGAGQACPRRGGRKYVIEQVTVFFRAKRLHSSPRCLIFACDSSMK